MSAEPQQIQAVFGRIIRDPALRDRVAEDPEATLAELGLDARSRAGMLAAGVERLLAYHTMVHARLRRTIASFLGPAAPPLGDERLRVEVATWIAERGPETPYLRDVAGQFVSWARPRWEADEALPPWLGELAQHQITTRALRSDPRVVGPQTEAKIDLERPIVCNPTTRVLRYRWAVHRAPVRDKKLEAEPEPFEPGHAVIGYRDAKHNPRFVELAPRSAQMFELLLAGQTLREALFGACEAVGETLDDEILSITAVTLADLVERHVLLGGGER
jgi:hypothetical protein